MSLGLPTKDQMILINRVRAYERTVTARERALAAAEAKSPGTDLVLNKRYVIPFTFKSGDLQPQTKVVSVDRSARWFLCKQLTFSLTEVGTTDGGLAISWTLNARFRPNQRSGTVLVRDSFRDRAWSDRPLPDGFFGNNNFGPRVLPCGAKLPGGTALSITYTPLSEFELTQESFMGITPTSYTFNFSFIGVELRGAAGAAATGESSRGGAL